MRIGKVNPAMHEQHVSNQCSIFYKENMEQKCKIFNLMKSSGVLTSTLFIKVLI